jgi:4a-hydroxytetrahydrobiopterin dehydratase
MNRIGLIADEMDHHPEWTLNGDSLTIGLSTHEIGGEVSLKDYILGYWIEEILNEAPLEDKLI